MKTILNTSLMHEPNKTFRDVLFDVSCRAIGRNRTKFFFKLYDLGRFDLLGKPKGAIGSIDVTNRCNLRCKHCYFYAHDYESQRELSDEEWISRLEELKQTDFPFYQCSWVGGEPLLRRELIERGMKYFKSNLVATNGTLELPNWQDVNFYVSIDGPQEMHDAIRGKGCYTRIKKNISRPDLKILVSMVITRMNYPGIERFLEEWRDTGAKGCLFQFYTAVRGLDNDDLWLNWDERDAIIDKLIKLKEEKYGDFIGIPTVVLQLMKSSTCREVTRNCLFRQQAFCLDPQGRVKKPCMMGPLADCERCGCVLPFHLKALESKKLMLRELLMNLKRKVGKRALA
ncbi:MAG TPA: radical SAM protein [Candidatus Brocadiia bacterium]|nr:radical SAM protein [Candidatus Brocadiales bacterium]